MKRERAVDPLTGLLNRRGVEEALDEPRYASIPMAVVTMDVDNFKRINNTHGHAAGDAVLRRLADVVRGEVREGDVAARLGGEELAVFVPDVDREAALLFSERLRSAVQDRVGDGGPCRPGHVRGEAGRQELRAVQRGVAAASRCLVRQETADQAGIT